MCHDVTQSHLFLAFGGKRVQKMILKKSLSFSCTKNAGEDRRSWKKAAKIDNLIKLIIFLRWNHHFSPLARQPLTSRNSVFCCIIVSRVWEDRAISQNMPTIVYQTNRYWLLAVLLWLARQYRRFLEKINFIFMTRQKCDESLECSIEKNLLRSALHSLLISQIKLN